MGSESRHREELASDLAREHGLDLARAIGLLQQAERAAVDDPARRSIRQWFTILLERDRAARAGATDTGDLALPGRGARRGPSAAAAVPGRQTLVMRAEREELARAEREAAPISPRPRAAAAAVAPAPAQPLDLATRWRMEQAFGFDFNGVSIYRDSALATGATRALVKDGEIHFRRGAYQPGTPAGDRLIAHELAHVVQQRGGAGARTASRRELEREADRAASFVARGRTAPIALRAQPGAAYAFSDDEDHHDGGGAELEAGGAPAPLTPAAVSDGRGGTAPQVSRTWLDAVGRSTGRPLPGELRRPLEVALQADLGDVRVHDGAISDAAAQEIHAKAFTLGKDIHFAQGRFEPGTRAGRELIAHEVAHAVQHGAGGDFTGATLSSPGDHHEVEAERFASELVRAEADHAGADHAGADRTAPRATGGARAVG
ncbi:MAG TPA: DUF4157 domain-containing protein, partial [Kofleriaceae bacterium]|nr:DUF4157 domain-containing protein [Kofleriaceae bacterium]